MNYSILYLQSKNHLIDDHNDTKVSMIANIIYLIKKYNIAILIGMFM